MPRSPPPSRSVTSIDARTRADGTARFAWRLGLAFGPQQLTVTSTAERVEPLAITATATGNHLRSLGGGDRGLCAVDLQGQLGCWDPLAHPDFPPTFTAVPGNERFQSVAIYSHRTAGADGCASTDAGRVWCFAVDEHATIGGLHELAGGYPPLVRLFTGSNDLDSDPPFCGLTTDGAAWCWGSNADGVLGDQSMTDRAAPVPVSTTTRFVQLAVGSYHACGVDLTTQGWCWGRNDRAQIGLPSSAVPAVMPVHRGGTLQYDAIVPVTTGATCAVAEGNAWCWGDKTALGAGSQVLSLLDTVIATPTPFPVDGIDTPTALGRVDDAVVVVGPGGLGAWWGDLSGVVDLVHADAPRRFVRDLGFRSLVLSESHGLVCGAASGTDDEWVCGRMASLTGYPTHQPSPAFAGFGMPLP